MVIGSSINSGTGAVAGRDCGILGASESVQCAGEEHPPR